jgi:hypothetical protein
MFYTHKKITLSNCLNVLQCVIYMSQYCDTSQHVMNLVKVPMKNSAGIFFINQK